MSEEIDGLAPDELLRGRGPGGPGFESRLSSSEVPENRRFHRALRTLSTPASQARESVRRTQVASVRCPRLIRVVNDTTNASPEVVEDACMFAWKQFLRYQPDRERGWRRWLITTAQRELWHLTAVERDHDSLGRLQLGRRRRADRRSARRGRDPQPSSPGVGCPGAGAGAPATGEGVAGERIHVRRNCGLIWAPFASPSRCWCARTSVTCRLWRCPCSFHRPCELAGDASAVAALGLIATATVLHRDDGPALGRRRAARLT